MTNEKKPHLVTRMRNHGRVVGKESGPGEGVFPNIVGYWQHRQRGGVVSGITLELLKTCIHFTKMCTFSAVRAIAGSLNTMVVSVPDSQALERGRSLCSMVAAPTRGGWATGRRHGSTER